MCREAGTGWKCAGAGFGEGAGAGAGAGAAVLPSRKSDQEISKSDFYQTIFLPKNQNKSGSKLAILRSKSDFFPKINSDIRQINFNLKIFHI